MNLSMRQHVKIILNILAFTALYSARGALAGLIGFEVSPGEGNKSDLVVKAAAYAFIPYGLLISLWMLIRVRDPSGPEAIAARAKLRGEGQVVAEVSSDTSNLTISCCDATLFVTTGLLLSTITSIGLSFFASMIYTSLTSEQNDGSDAFQSIFAGSLITSPLSLTLPFFCYVVFIKITYELTSKEAMQEGIASLKRIRSS